jgi:hypothetical protein
MSCFVDIQPVRTDGELLDNQPRTCDKSTVECSIKDFFAKEKSSFEEGLEGIGSSQKP